VQVNLGVNKADVVLRPFLYVGAALQRRLGARAGDVVACRLRPADPDHVPVPADVQAALDASGRDGAFARCRPPSAGGFCSRSRAPPKSRRGDAASMRWFARCPRPLGQTTPDELGQRLAGAASAIRSGGMTATGYRRTTTARRTS
jgi:hypothetical protein